MTEQFTADNVIIPPAEVLRYLGYGRSRPDAGVSGMLISCIDEFQSIASYRACRLLADVALGDGDVEIAGMHIESRNLRRGLDGCGKAIIFAATAGAQPDRMVERYRLLSPARAAVLDAVGSAAVEAWCNQLCEQWRAEFFEAGLQLRPRRSPGYGDFPIGVQSELLGLLDASRRAGISLTDTGMMLPIKSVSAVVGLGMQGCTSPEQDCERCGVRNCAFRR